MKITYLDVDSREIVDVRDDPANFICEIGAERFAARLGATVVKILPAPQENEWQVELKIPSQVRRLHMPFPGDPVRFTANVGLHQREVDGVYQFQRNHSYVIVDESGDEWELPSMWQISKL